MPNVSVWVDAEDVLEDLDDDELRAELERRTAKDQRAAGAPQVSEKQLLERAYYELRGKCESPALRDYMHLKLGRIL